MLIKLLLFFVICKTIDSYNLEVKYPIIYVDPAQNVPGAGKNLFGHSAVLRPWIFDNSSFAW